MKNLVKYVGDEVKIEEIKDSARLKFILNSGVNTKWLKTHPTAKNVKYLPIDKIEILLDMIFQEWRIELLSVSQLAQSVCVTVRVHYKNPITGEWSFHDGVGASPLQTNAGKSAADLANIKNNAVQLAAPAAKSYAIKEIRSAINFYIKMSRSSKKKLKIIRKNSSLNLKLQKALKNFKLIL